MPTIMPFSDIKKDIETSDYKRVCLADKNGKILIPFNSRNVKLAARLTEVDRRLKSVAMKPGVYQIHAKHWDNVSEPGIYYVGVGNQKEQLADIAVVDMDDDQDDNKHLPMVQNGNTVSWEQYQAVYLENLELQNTVARLEMEIDALNAELDDLENEPEKDGGFLSEGTRKWFDQLADHALPLLDKFMEQRDKKLNLQANELYLRYGGGQPSQSGANAQKVPASSQNMRPVNDPGQEEEEEIEIELTEQDEMILDALNQMKQDNPELYKTMVEKLDNYYQDDNDQ